MLWISAADFPRLFVTPSAVSHCLLLCVLLLTRWRVACTKLLPIGNEVQGRGARTVNHGAASAGALSLAASRRRLTQISSTTISSLVVKLLRGCRGTGAKNSILTTTFHYFPRAGSGRQSERDSRRDARRGRRAGEAAPSLSKYLHCLTYGVCLVCRHSAAANRVHCAASATANHGASSAGALSLAVSRRCLTQISSTTVSSLVVKLRRGAARRAARRRRDARRRRTAQELALACKAHS